MFHDADLDAAANGVDRGHLRRHAGRPAWPGRGLLVHADVHDELVERVVAPRATIKLGNPLEPRHRDGPAGDATQFDDGHSAISSPPRAEGATVACGGGPTAELGGWFVEPTVLTDTTPTCALVREEIFGPVVAVTTFRDEDEAVALANATRVRPGRAGLDAGRAPRAPGRRALRAGTVWINAYRVVAPHVPFGGSGASGIGRENGVDAVREYTETKAVWVELTGATRDPFTLG